MAGQTQNGRSKHQEWLYEIIFGTESKAGRVFDIVLLIAILASIVVIMLESVQDIRTHNSDLLFELEIAFTVLFSAEYIVRIYCARNRLRYITSFYGIIDLLSILPTYIALIIHVSPASTAIRAIRLLRTFRILKLAKFLREAETLRYAIHASRAKIAVFLATVLILIVIVGSTMYVVEKEFAAPGQESPFTSIPQSMYWAVVTMTTVGYGDISPQTNIGKFIASLMMIVGYAMIIVPTGIVSAELSKGSGGSNLTRMIRACNNCNHHGHDKDAKYCKSCGAEL